MEKGLCLGRRYIRACDRGASGCHLNFPPFVLSRTRARQEVFVFILHLFTRVPQMVVSQCVRGEGFLFLGSRW